MKFTWEDNGSEFTFTVAGWIFLALTVISLFGLIGCMIYLGFCCEPGSQDAGNAACLAFVFIFGLITGVISTPMCIKCVRCDKSISQVLRELIDVMTWGA